MAELGERWVESVLEQQEFKCSHLSTEDFFATHSNLGLIIEEKDYKYPIKVGKTKAYQIVGHKTFPFKISQIIKHSQKIMEQLRINNKFFMIVHIYIISNLAGGRQVYVVRDKGYEIFFVHRNYFPVWLNNLKKVYLGIPCIEGVNYYMGGK